MNNDSATKASPARSLINTRQSTVLIHNNHMNFYTLLFCSFGCHTKIQPVINAMVKNIRSPFTDISSLQMHYKCSTKCFIYKTPVYQQGTIHYLYTLAWGGRFLYHIQIILIAPPPAFDDLSIEALCPLQNTENFIIFLPPPPPPPSLNIHT